MRKPLNSPLARRKRGFRRSQRQQNLLNETRNEGVEDVCWTARVFRHTRHQVVSRDLRAFRCHLISTTLWMISATQQEMLRPFTILSLHCWLKDVWSWTLELRSGKLLKGSDSLKKVQEKVDVVRWKTLVLFSLCRLDSLVCFARVGRIASRILALCSHLLRRTTGSMM